MFYTPQANQKKSGSLTDCNNYNDFYKKKYTTICVTFLDVSKAFDRVNYWLLFTKLIGNYVPLFVVNVLIYKTGNESEMVYYVIFFIPGW